MRDMLPYSQALGYDATFARFPWVVRPATDTEMNI
jgi:hypothetical protein